MTTFSERDQTNLKRKLCDRIYRAVSRDESPSADDLLAALRMCATRPAHNGIGRPDPVLLQLDTILDVAVRLYQRDHGPSAA